MERGKYNKRDETRRNDCPCVVTCVLICAVTATASHCSSHCSPRSCLSFVLFCSHTLFYFFFFLVLNCLVSHSFKAHHMDHAKSDQTLFSFSFLFSILHTEEQIHNPFNSPCSPLAHNRLQSNQGESTHHHALPRKTAHLHTHCCGALPIHSSIQRRSSLFGDSLEQPYHTPSDL